MLHGLESGDSILKFLKSVRIFKSFLSVFSTEFFLSFEHLVFEIDNSVLIVRINGDIIYEIFSSFNFVIVKSSGACILMYFLFDIF